MPQISRKATYDTIESIYECAVGTDASAWHRLYSDISKTINSGPGGLALHLADDDRFSVIASTFEPDQLTDYFEYYQFISPFRQEITNLKPGEVFESSTFMDCDVYEETEYYQDFQRKAGVYETKFYSLSADNGVMGGIGFSRPKDNIEFTSDERRFIATIMPHLRRAFASFSKLREYSSSNSLMAEALNQVNHGILAITKNGRIVFSNDAAEKLLDARDGLMKKGEVLSACSPPDNLRLKGMLDAMFSPLERLGDDGITGLTVARRDDKRPLELTITAVSANGVEKGDSERLALITIHDADRVIVPSGILLTKIYNLTFAESRMASLLASGATIQEITERLSVSKNTARTHLKRIFSKTSTRRQSELVKLILNGSATTNILILISVFLGI